MASASDFRTGLLLCCSFFSKNQGSLLPGKNFNNASSRPTPTSNSIKAYTTPRSAFAKPLAMTLKPRVTSRQFHGRAIDSLPQ